MLLEYIQEALRRARYELIDDEEPYYGEVPDLPGVWATGKTLEECRENLREVIEGWIIVRLRKGLPLPPLGNGTKEKRRNGEAERRGAKKTVAAPLVGDGHFERDGT